MKNRYPDRKCSVIAAILLTALLLFVPRLAISGDWPGIFHFKGLSPDKIKGMPLVSTSLVDVQVPVQITKLPLSLRQGTLVVGFMALFFGQAAPAVNINSNSSQNNTLVGYAWGRKRYEGLLSGGSLQKVISVPSNECRGVISNDFTVISYAVVKKGDQCLPLGVGCKSSGGSSSDCGFIVNEFSASMFCDENVTVLW